MEPGAKKLLFTMLLVLLPAVFLVVLEGILRLLGLFRQEPFIVESTKRSKDVYQLNQWVAKRYFDPRHVSVPGVSPEVFARDKGSRTFRIFCLGESTTAGFPFDCQVPFPKQLAYLLSQSYPDYKFEVINAGISAVNSFTVVDLLPDILDHAPDLILLYLGHNEFYGAYGSASTVSMGQNDGLIRFYLKLQKLRVVQMLKRLLSVLTPSEEVRPSQQTLMAGVIKDQAIPYESEKYKRSMHSFRHNLDIILHQCAERGVPVVLSNLFSNVRDLPPFASQTSAAMQAPGYVAAVARGDSLFARQDYRESVMAYRTALAHDSSSAQLWYILGRTCAAANDSTAARYYLCGAKDRDLIRFRASEEVNQIIAEAARLTSTRLVDMLRLFTDRSAQGLIGNDWMVDHLHPNPNGYYLMARAFYEAINSMGLLVNRDQAFVPADQPYFVTDLDWDIGLLKSFEMLHRWPFPEKPVSFADYHAYGDPQATPIAREYLFVNNVWSTAHYNMAEAYLKQGEYEKARREYLAVSVFAPDDPYPPQQVAKTYEMEGAWDRREAFLELALARSEQKGMIHYQIAIAQWKQKKLSAACESMLDAINLPDLNREQKQNARFYLAGFYADANEVDRAKEILIQILHEDPNFPPARMFLQKLLANREAPPPQH